jgi:hypothetical protein
MALTVAQMRPALGLAVLSQPLDIDLWMPAIQLPFRGELLACIKRISCAILAVSSLRAA